MEENSVTTRHGNWLKEQLYLDYCVTDYVIVQRNKERKNIIQNIFQAHKRLKEESDCYCTCLSKDTLAADFMLCGDLNASQMDKYAWYSLIF
jgi:hypothetical protein